MRALRREFLLEPSITYLNHGSFGATPRAVFAVYQAWQRELERQPVEFLDRRFAERMAVSRAILGEYLGTQRDNLVYVTNATVAVNIVARSLDLGPGDEVLATDHEYGACDRAWRYLSHKRGFTYVNHPLSMPVLSAEAFVAQMWQAVNASTRVIYLSHITSPTALVLPVAAVCHRARDQGILTLVDGAHAPGQLSLDLDAIGADFYAGNLHKWLCAPKGAGFLYARPEAQELLEPLVVSWGYQPEKPGPSRFIDHHEWWGTRDLAAFLSVPAAIQFQETNNWEDVREACHALAVAAEERICQCTGLPSLYSHDHWYLQMVSIALPESIEINVLKARLYDDHRIEVPLFAWKGQKLIRVSFQGYNSRRDLNRLVAGLQSLL